MENLHVFPQFEDHEKFFDHWKSVHWINFSKAKISLQIEAGPRYTIHAHTYLMNEKDEKKYMI